MKHRRQIESAKNLIDQMKALGLCLWGHRISGIPSSFRSLLKLRNGRDKQQRLLKFANFISCVPAKSRQLVWEVGSSRDWPPNSAFHFGAKILLNAHSLPLAQQVELYSHFKRWTDSLSE